MYSLTIHFGPNAVAWSFMFKEKEKAQKILYQWTEFGSTTNTVITFTDDFGQEVAFNSTMVHGILFEDGELSQEARIIRSLDQARGQARANKRAASDPELQALMRGQGGPSVLTPFANGGFR